MKKSRMRDNILKRILCVMLIVCMVSPSVVTYASPEEGPQEVGQGDNDSDKKDNSGSDEKEHLTGTSESTEDARTEVRTLRDEEVSVSVSDVYYMSGDSDGTMASIPKDEESGAYLLTEDILAQSASYGVKLSLEMIADENGWDIINGDTYQMSLDGGSDDGLVEFVTGEGDVVASTESNELKIGVYSIQDGLLKITYNDSLSLNEDKKAAANLSIGYAINHEILGTYDKKNVSLRFGQNDVNFHLLQQTDDDNNNPVNPSNDINEKDIIVNNASNDSESAGVQIAGDILGQNKWGNDVIVPENTVAVAGKYNGEILKSSVDKSDRNVNFKVDSELLDEYLLKVMEIAGKRTEEGEGDPQDENWWASQESNLLQPIVFTIHLGSASDWEGISANGFTTSDISEGLTVELYSENESEVKIADAIFAINASGKLELILKFNTASIYLGAGDAGESDDQIKAGLTFSLQMSESKFNENENYTVNWNDKKELELTKTDGGGEEGNTETKFEISKVVSSGTSDDDGKNTTVTEAKFTYTIEAGKKQRESKDKEFKYASLENTVLTDTLPAGLLVTAIRVNDVPLNENQYSIEGNKVLYTFTDADSKTDLTDPDNLAYGKAKVEIDVELDPENTVEFGTALENKVTITEPGTTNSGTDTQYTTVKKPTLSKVGEIDPYDSNRVAWTITAETYFSQSAVDSYIVDCIDNTVQHYDLDTLFVDKSKLKVIDCRETELDEKYSYANLNESAGEGAKLVRTLLEELNVSDNDAGAYLVRIGKNDMLIIPYAKYHNSSRTITYETILDSEYVDNAMKPDESGYVKGEEIKNDVTLLWDYKGNGPGPESLEWYVGISKNPIIKDSDVVKEGVGYNEKSHTATWKVRLDPYGKGFKGNVIIKDILKKDDQTLIENSVKLYKYIKDGTDFKAADGFNPKVLTKTVNLSTSKEDKDITYSYVECDVDGTIGGGDYNLLQIPINDTSADVRYVVEFQTEVKNQNILSNHGGGSLGNIVEISYNNGEKSISGKGEQKAENHLISKEAVKQEERNSAYNFADQTVTWEVTINEHSLDILNAYLEEILPFGSTLTNWAVRAGFSGEFKVPENDVATVEDNIKIVKKTLSNDNIVKGNGNSSGKFTTDNDGKFIQRTEIFEFQSTASSVANCTIKGPYTFRFTTQFTDDEFLKAFLMQNYNEVTFINKATLHGSVNGKEITNAIADASCKINPSPVIKTGEPNYEPEGSDESDSITWTVYINKNKADISGSTITEDFSRSGILEMDPDSLELYNVPTVPADGKLTAENDGAVEIVAADISSKVGTIEYSSGKFVIKINKKSDNFKFSDCLKLKFKTYLVDEWQNKVAPLTNKVTVSQEGGYKYSTGDIDSNYKKEFKFSQWANSSSSSMLRILKYSHKNNNPNTDELVLQGAVINLDVYSLQEEKYVYDAVRSKQRTTGKTGYANFVSLREGIVYHLYESKAPSGYELDTERNYYYMFVGDGSEYSSDELDVAINKDGKKEDVKVKLIRKKNLNTNSEKTGYLKEDRDIKFPNNPAENMSISIKKSDGDGNELNNVTFILKSKKEELSEHKGSTKNGVITFSNIDPGEYTLEEIVPDNLKEYYTISAIDVKISPGDNNSATISLPNGIGDNEGKIEIEVDNTSNIASLIIKNLYKKGSIILKKVDAGTGNPLNGAEFSIKKGGSNTTIQEKVASDENGIVRFGNLPFSQTGYEIAETKAPEHYSLNNDVITISAQDMRDAANENGFAVDLSGDVNTNKFVKNSRIMASIKFKKYLRLEDFSDSDAKVYDKLLTLGRTFTLTSLDADTSSYIANKEDHYSFISVDGEWVRKIDRAEISSNPSYAFKGIPLGKYRLVEVTSENAGDKYTPCTIDIDLAEAYDNGELTGEGEYIYNVNFNKAEGDADGTIVNNLLSTEIYLSKTDGLTGEMLEDGAEFSLEGTPDDTSGITLNKKCKVKDGKLVLNNEKPIILPIGVYKLTETKAPENYTVSEKKYIITVVSECIDNTNHAVAYIKSESDTSDGLGTICSNPNEPYAISNDAITGSLSLIKLGKGYTDSGADPEDTTNDTVVLKDRLPISGATFKLIPVVEKDEQWVTVKETDAGGNVTDKIVDEGTTEEDGRLTFEELPYSNYLLVEETPDGYYAMNPVLLKKEYFDISKSDEADTQNSFQWSGQYNNVAYEDGSYTIKGELEDFSPEEDNRNIIIDVPVVIDASFTKIVIDNVEDTEGNVLTDAKFTVARLGTGGGAEDANPFNAAYDLSKKFVPYVPCSEVTPNDKGIVVLRNLICGIYEITETEWKEGSRPVDAKPIVVMYLKVARNDEGGFSVWRYKAIENGELVGNSYEVIDIDGLESESANMGIVANSPYELGSIEFSKQSNDEGKQPLNGAKFGLYRWNDTKGEYEPVIMYKGGEPVTVETAGDADAKGKASFNYLTYGKYAIKELKAPEGHILDNTYYEFKIYENNLTGLITNPGIVDNIITNKQNSYQIQKQDMSGKLLNGAVFTVTGRFANGTASTTKTYTVNGTSALIAGELVAGESYVIKETAAPAGYSIAAPIMVYIDENGQLYDSAENKIADNKVIIKDEMIDMGLYKVSAENFSSAGTSVVTRLEGAEFTVSPVTGSVFADGSKSLTINDQNYSTAFKGKLVAGNSYTVTETKAPYGYTVAAPFTFSVNANGGVSIASAARNYVKASTSGQLVIYVADEQGTGDVTLVKKDAGSSEELPGAGFKLYRKSTAGTYALVADKILYSGNTYKMTGTSAIDNGTANSPANGKLTVSGLPWGSYQFVEVAAPAGYVLDGTPYSFDITGSKANGMSVDLGTVKNQKTAVKVSKVDESGAALSGATLAILNSDGKEEERWVTDGTVHIISGLIPGATYKLHEVKAPAGYELADDITFTVPANGQYELSMTDIKKPTPTPTPTPGGTTGSVVVTKTVFYEGKPLAIHDLSFYAALYSDADLTNRVSEIMELAFTGSYSTTVTFDNLPLGTYYVAEVDEFGDVYDGSDIGMEVEVIDQQCVLTRTSPRGSAVIKNTMPELPDGFYIDPTGKLTVTKKVLNKDKTEATVKNTSFYVTLFSDEDYLLAVSDPMEIEIANGSSGTVIFDELALGTYYLAETDEDGFPVDAESDDFAYTPVFSKDSFEIADENQSVEVTLTNTLKKGEVTPTATPKATVTTKPGTYSSSPAKSTLSTGTSSKAANAKTGDETPLFWYFVLLAAASAGIILAAGRKRKRMK